MGAALLELPLRDAGFLLPTWDELVAFSGACRARGIPLHLDGARIWESAPHLAHPPREVAALADSVYVSFYKGLGGLAGAALAGPEEQVAQARLWRTRMGGTLFSLLPYAVAALRGLDTELPRMPEYHERAVVLASAWSRTASGSARRRRTRTPSASTCSARWTTSTSAGSSRWSASTLALTPRWRAADVPGWSWTEFGVGPATMQWEVDEVVETLAARLRRLSNRRRVGPDASRTSSPRPAPLSDTRRVDASMRGGVEDKGRRLRVMVKGRGRLHG